MTKRSRVLDTWRGFAVGLMAFDHILAITGEGYALRATVTRLSMPLFFLVSGHLLYRIKWQRLIPVAVLGVYLPEVIPFIESPNVLFLYAFFAPFIVWAKDRPIVLIGIVAFGLAMYANGYFYEPGAYAPFALFGLLAVGKMIPRGAWGEWENGFLAGLGRYPLSFYVGHLFVLESVRRWAL